MILCLPCTDASEELSPSAVSDADQAARLRCPVVEPTLVGLLAGSSAVTDGSNVSLIELQPVSVSARRVLTLVRIRRAEWAVNSLTLS